jgi:hypothetical protein
MSFKTQRKVELESESGGKDEGNGKWESKCNFRGKRKFGSQSKAEVECQSGGKDEGNRIIGRKWN